MRHFHQHRHGGECRRFVRGEGPHGRGFGRGGRLGRFLEHGDLRVLVLHLLNQQPRHGYDLIKEIEGLTGGAYAPSPGVIYPTLTMLEELGQAEAAAEGAKKLYSITAAGREALAQNGAGLAAIMARLQAATPRAAALPVMRAMENLKTALRLKLGSETVPPETVRQIADLLDQTARRIEDL
ncbi:PadR family transcriptional regulator [Acidocella sp. KAb 2-4]|uniref:PadR family transcriptional regulator n=1 Tax=Acidocella sp. KAb 2-4 TaxID=2885158 RepID=UPI001D087117|nr:PadR family transcriptional regulator [Acidocella sp. KAb 2-4]MCB5943378.1 PadR family transcriptional regulator [Acidocella sp. KAb 2-4]